MKPAFYLFLFTILACNAPCFSQNTGFEWFFTPNANLSLLINTPTKGAYPILWYDKETDPKLLIGGFGMGLSAFKTVSGKVGLKGQTNLSKQTYWDEPIMATDESGFPIQTVLTGSSDYSLGITATAHYFLSKKLSVGTGLGAQVLLLSLSRLPEINTTWGPSPPEKGIARNRYYKPIMPVVPLEISLKLNKTLFNIRYEYGLLNRLKGNMAQYKTDRFSLLTFEVGFKIK
jgi:hypothetical protein